MNKKTLKNITPLFLLFFLIACNKPKEKIRSNIDLAGEWQFALDSTNIGEQQKWYLNHLNDYVNLPGTTDLNHKGYYNTDTTTMHLNRLYTYEGAAWYRKEISIPENFKDKHIQLFFERSKNTKVWIDSTFIGGSHLLESPQTFDITDYVTPGKHSITVMVNNDLKLTPYGNVHIYSDDTQTNWNGIIGKIHIEASAKSYISDLQVFPDIDNQTANISIKIDDQLNLNDFNVEISVEKIANGETSELETQKFTVSAKEKINLQYKFKDGCELWDDYNHTTYKLTATIFNGDITDEKSVPFGMREFKANGTQFSINGRTTFLRGKHEAAVFPLTGFPPMDTEGWIRVFKIAKSYGINHYRFHSYCPPEAAFSAADQEGIFIQAELPFWGGLDSANIVKRLKAEGVGLLKAYANHPSFVLFSPGNEIWSGHDNAEELMSSLKKLDNRPLYCIGSNDCSGYIPPRDFCDFFVGAHVPDNGDGKIGDTRLTNAFCDAKDGGILNTHTPSTDVNFEYAIGQMNIPVISHEIGQYQIYPDYKEIDKYSGVLKAWNLEKFKKGLENSGLGNMDSIFQKASGAWSAICYKAEMEAALRTKGMAGFQLLDLQDFPGQGTALVGVLDAFMDSKNVVTPACWKQSCNDITVLLEMSKFCWTNTETLKAKIEIANYSNKSLNGSLIWKIQKQDGSVLSEGKFADLQISNGGLFSIGELNKKLSEIKSAERLNINLSIPNTEYSNSYPIWVYPTKEQIVSNSDLNITYKLTPQILSKLENGEKVLLFPKTEDVKSNSFPGLFPPEFWNYGMFKQISESNNKPVSSGTLGLLMNPEHPLFKSFPTDYYTNWQWFSIIKASNSLILDNTDDSYLPIVQVIDNLERNHKLGLIFEFKVGKGKLLICMSQLKEIKDNPEANQLYNSILKYMESDDFNPDYTITPAELKELL
jgi:hypothetical protein